jgi:hypothetical protein
MSIPHSLFAYDFHDPEHRAADALEWNLATRDVLMAADNMPAEERDALVARVDARIARLRATLGRPGSRLH